MQETFKNISIFILFLLCILLWNAAKEEWLVTYFRFSHGRTALLLFWSSCVVAIFHLLYHYIGRGPEKLAYITTLLMLLVVSLMVHLDKVSLR